MKSWVRAGFFLFGTVSVYLALFAAFAKSMAISPGSFYSLTEHVVLVLLSAILVFATAWRLAPERRGLAGGVIAVIFYLLNPAVVFQGLLSPWAGTPYAALSCMLFLCGWIAMDHWSVFMRSGMLAILFAGALWGGSSNAWIVLALVPWVVYNRRPLVSMGAFLTIVLGGVLLFFMSWALVHWLAGQPRAILAPWRFLGACERWGGLTLNRLGSLGAPQSMDRMVDVFISLSPAWIVLAFWSTGRQLVNSVLQRRSDVLTFACGLAWIMFMVTSAAVLLGVERLSSVTTFVALSAPLVARDLAQREFYLHRGVRVIVLWAFLTAAGIQWLTMFILGAPTTGGLWRLWSAGVAAVVTLFISTAAKETKGVTLASRWQAILAGGTLASYINVGYLLLKS